MDTLTRIRAVNDSAYTENRKETDIYHVKRNINRHFMDSTDYEPVVLINGEKFEGIVSNYKNSLTDKYLMVRPDKTFKLGALVDVYSSYYLVTELNPDRQVRTRGRLQQCNDELRWQDKDSLELMSQWCIMQKPYFSNLEDLRSVEVSTREFKLLISENEFTSKFDIGMRFMLEIINGKGKTYRVTSVDVHTGMVVLDGVKQGFLIVNLEEDQFNPNTDRVDLQIADYISPTPLPLPPSNVHAEFQYTGEPEIKQGNSRYKEFMAVVVDANGNVVVGAVADIEVNVVVPELAQYVTSEIELGRVQLRCSNKVPIGTQIQLVASYGGSQIGELIVRVVSIY